MKVRLISILNHCFSGRYEFIGVVTENEVSSIFLKLHISFITKSVCRLLLNVIKCNFPLQSHLLLIQISDLCIKVFSLCIKLFLTVYFVTIKSSTFIKNLASAKQIQPQNRTFIMPWVINKSYRIQNHDAAFTWSLFLIIKLQDNFSVVQQENKHPPSAFAALSSILMINWC